MPRGPNYERGTGSALKAGVNPHGLACRRHTRPRLPSLAPSLAGWQGATRRIGNAVELAGEKAKAINDETQLQNAMLDKLEENIEEVKAKMSTVNVSMKKNWTRRGTGSRIYALFRWSCSR